VCARNIDLLIIGETVFQGLQALLDPRNPADRQARAIVRLNRYAGQETGFEPITELAKARTEEMLGDAKLVRPYVAEVNDAIKNTQTYLDGIAELFRTAISRIGPIRSPPYRAP
jgi:hypothetical protein